MRIIEEMKEMNRDYKDISISICPKMREMVGRTIGTIAESQSIEPEEAIIELLISAGGHVIVFDKGVISPENIEREMQNEHCIISSADAAYNVEYVRTGERVHPRCFGAFARVLGEYVREKQILTLEQAIFKMTSLPAQKIGIQKRGLLKKDYFADVVIFDENNIADLANFENPYQCAEGISHVIINGKVVVDEGVHTGELAGAVLTK
jgi:N-acyl-D-amino-acid deacylase